jgi:hypothetical protein
MRRLVGGRSPVEIRRVTAQARGGWNSNQRRRTGKKLKASKPPGMHLQAVVNCVLLLRGAIEGGVRDNSAEHGVASGL